MAERLRNYAEKEARKEAVEIYRTLGIPGLDDSSTLTLWRNLLRKTRGRFEKFRYKPTSYRESVFAPQVYEEGNDEQVTFFTQVPSIGYQPTIEWRVLERKTPETKTLFTAILNLKKGEPSISLMQETMSIFRAKGLKIDDLLHQHIPKMSSEIAVIQRREGTYFERDELDQRVEGGYIMTVAEVLSRINIPE